MPFKIYVDSKHRVRGSCTDFEYALPHVINVSGKCIVDACLIPNTFNCIRANENDRIHIRENATVYRIVQLNAGQYNSVTLRDEVKRALDTGRSLTGVYTVTHNLLTQTLTIGTSDSSGTIHLYPTKLLETDSNQWNVGAFAEGGPTIDQNLMSAGKVIGMHQGENILNGSLNVDVVLTEVVNLLPYPQLFLKSHNLGTGTDAIGSMPASSQIIRRICAQAALNDTIYDLHSLPFDSVTVGEKQISSLAFRLTDSDDNVVDTRNHDISFSIIFVEE